MLSYAVHTFVTIAVVITLPNTTDIKQLKNIAVPLILSGVSMHSSRIANISRMLMKKKH